MSDARTTGRSERPASPRHREYLEALLRDAGYPTFLDARRPLGLTQRQSKGRFTGPEASALIDALLEAQRGGGGAGAGGGSDSIDSGSIDAESVSAKVAASINESLRERRALDAERRLELERVRQVRSIPADLLADELLRRGWHVTPPA